MSEGGSPYESLTYRYTPILAWILLPNIYLDILWGKVLFSLFDLLTGEYFVRLKVVWSELFYQLKVYSSCQRTGRSIFAVIEDSVGKLRIWSVDRELD